MPLLLLITLFLSSTSFAETAALALPDTSHRVKNFSKVIGWPSGKTPIAPPGFQVSKLADGFRNPRWMYVAPNGDVFVSEAETEAGLAKKIGSKFVGADKSQNMGNSANRITRLVLDENGKVKERSTYLQDLKQPFGMLIMNDSFYIANTDSLWMYPYKAGEKKMSGKGKKILDLPAGGYNNHWTRNLIASPDNTKIYISVGSGSNVAENGMNNEVRRANILEINPDGSDEVIFASGLRNPVGMDFSPESKKLWTAVNERDDLGDDLVPDYITEVKKDAFYGWPYSYFGANVDPRPAPQNPELVKKAIVPDYALVSHTASLGLSFYRGGGFPALYKNGAFIGQHGSWNRTDISGYKVVFVPFKDGHPNGATQDFLTGFISDAKKSEVYGRPVGVTEWKDGSLLVTDDSSNTIWRVSYSQDAQTPSKK